MRISRGIVGAPNSDVGYAYVMASRTTAKTAVTAKTPSRKNAANAVSAAHRKVATSKVAGGNPTDRQPTRTAPRQKVPRARTAARKVGSTTKSPLPRSVTRVVAGAGYLPERRAEFVIRVLGNQRAADLLRVSKSQPSRWKSGEEAPGPAAARRLVDLDHVLARLGLVWDESLAADWLTTPNGFLDGATPMQVIESRGTTEVIEAIDAEAEAAFV
jgi:hypothetical protein